MTERGSPLAIGRTAEVFAWEEGRVLKLFREQVSLGVVEHEARVARAVHAAGLPVPAIGDIVEVTGRYGLVYERVAAASMLELVTSRPWRAFEYARLLAELQATVHEIEAVNGMPDQRDQMGRKIRQARVLSPALQHSALHMLAEMPESNRLCHGDFHPGNVLMAARGPVIIDWIDATLGSPLADVARSSLLMSSAPAPRDPWVERVMSRLRDLFHGAYIRHYFRLRPGGREELARWRIVNAAARLSEGVPEERDLLVFVVEALRRQDLRA